MTTQWGKGCADSPTTCLQGCHALSIEPSNPGQCGEWAVSPGLLRAAGEGSPGNKGQMSPQAVTSLIKRSKSTDSHSKPRGRSRRGFTTLWSACSPHHPAWRRTCCPSQQPPLSFWRHSPSAGGYAGPQSEPTAQRCCPGSRCTRSHFCGPSRRQSLRKEKGRTLLESRPSPRMQARATSEL